MTSMNEHRTCHPALPAQREADTVPRSAFPLPRSAEHTLGRQLAAGRQAAQQLQVGQEGGASLPLARLTRLQVLTRPGEQARARLIGACASLVERVARQ